MNTSINSSSIVMAFQKEEAENKKKQEELRRLSPQVFGVYCDRAVKEAVESNNKLRAQNAKMEDVRYKLTHMTVFAGDAKTTPAKIISLQQGRTWAHDESKMAFNVATTSSDEDEAPLEVPFKDILQLSVEPMHIDPEASTATLSHHILEIFPLVSMNENEKSAHFLLFVSKDVIVSGTLKNFEGTAREIQGLIDDSDQFKSLFTQMCFINHDTGEPFARLPACLRGAIFSLDDKIIVSKAILHPVVFMNEDQFTEEVEDELQVLAHANEHRHHGLAKALHDRKTLGARNGLLRQSRDVFKTITARHGDSTIEFLLDKPLVGGMVLQDKPAIGVKPEEPDGEDTNYLSIPLGAIRAMELQLAGVPWSIRVSPFYLGGGPAFADHEDGVQSCMVVQYSPYIEALYFLDGSMDDVDVGQFPDGLAGFIRMSLTNLEQGHQLDPSYTMRLSELRIDQSFIKDHMAALGFTDITPRGKNSDNEKDDNAGDDEDDEETSTDE